MSDHNYLNQNSSTPLAKMHATVCDTMAVQTGVERKKKVQNEGTHFIFLSIAWESVWPSQTYLIVWSFKMDFCLYPYVYCTSYYK